MKVTFANSLVCRNCWFERLEVQIFQENDVEVRNGNIHCPNCKVDFPVKDGILLLEQERLDLPHMTEAEKRLEEEIGLNDEWLLSLPHPAIDFETSFEFKGGDKAMNFEQIWTELKITGREKVLELGAGTCWVSNHFTASGCESVACDIELRKYYGLRSAEVYLYHENANKNYFERIQMGFGRLPFKDESFDIIFIQSAFQYAEDLNETLKQIYRVLKPGGRLAFVYQGVTGILKSRKYYGQNRSILTYLNIFKSIGLNTSLFFPASIIDNMGRGMSERRKFYRIAGIFSILWNNVPFIKKLVTKHGIIPMTLLFGVPISAIVTKPANLNSKV